MKTIIIYHTEHHNNTEKIAKAMAETLNAKLVKTEDVDETVIEGYDLIGFGSGIYNGKHHKSLLKLVDGLKKQKDSKAFTFSTSGLREIRFIHEYNKKLRKKLQEKNFTILGEFNCRGWDTHPLPVRIFGGINKGRPNVKDMEKARKFAEELIKNMI